MILVSKKLAMDKWVAVDIGSPDITRVRIRMSNTNIVVYNVYCDCRHSDSIQDLKQYLRREEVSRNDSEADIHMVWLGDFNRHHPEWDKEQNSHLFTRANLDEAQTLLDATSSSNLVMALPKGVPMLMAMSTGNNTQTDNVFISAYLHQHLISCNTVPEDRPARSDHFPIDTVIEAVASRTTQVTKYNY